MDKGRNFNNQIIIGGIVVIVLLFIGWWLTTKPATGPTGTENTSSSEGTSTSVGLGGESVSAKDQAPGMSVAIESVTLAQTGWVAIRDDNGRVLGAARFDAGTYKGVSVPLLRATVANGSYQVLLYADDGDKQFDLHKDILISSEAGGVLGTTFKTN